MLIYAVALGVLALLVMLYRRDRSLLQAQRAKFFDLCFDLFQSYRVTQEYFRIRTCRCKPGAMGIRITSR